MTFFRLRDSSYSGAVAFFCTAISRMEACPPRSNSVSSITGW